METPLDMARKVMKFANDHADYNGNGLDVIVECYTYNELAEEIAEAGHKSSAEAIAYYSRSMPDREAIGRENCACYDV